LDRLKLTPGETYFEMPYDWRRDNRVAARKLQRLSEQWLAARRKTHPDAKLVLICHSMGGIIARIFLEMMGGWRECRRLITIGTPYSGSFNSLETLCNGFHVGPWVLKADLTETLSSFTSIYQLLPSFRCIAHPQGGETVALDAPGLGLPGIDALRLSDALALHRAIRAAVDTNREDKNYQDQGYRIRPIVGNFVETNCEARLSAGRLVVTADPFGGDGTVPKLSALPHEQLANADGTDWLNEKHGSMQNNAKATDGIASLLQHHDEGLVFTAPNIKLSVTAADALIGQEVLVRAETSQPTQDIRCKIQSIATGRAEVRAMAQDPDSRTGAVLRLSNLAAGDYRLSVEGAQTNAVTDLLSIVDPDE
jgi:pimeloyl-ACP methyl ester carboxylesterase